ncbi:MAG: energy-coupling factor transporter transmembrane component T [Zestosphaera sp.]
MKRTLLGYLPLESPVHSFHPIVKTFFLLIVSVYPLLIDSPDWNLVGIFVLLIIFYLSRIDVSILRFYTTIMLNIFWIIFIAYTFFGGYSPDYHVVGRLGPIIVSWENIAWAFSVYCRMFWGILIIIYFLSVSRERDIILGLRWLRLPYVISYTAGLALRSIGLSIIDFNTIREAEKARALDMGELPLTHKIKKFGLYIVPLMSLALRRTDEVSNALDARGFSFAGWRDSRRTEYMLSKYEVRLRDLLVIALMVFMLLALLYLKLTTAVLSTSNSLVLGVLARALGVS